MTFKNSEKQELSVYTPADTPEDDYFFKKGDVLELDDGIFTITEINGDVIELQDTTTDEVFFIAENELYGTGFAVLKEANTTLENSDIAGDFDVATLNTLQVEEIDPLSLIGKHYIIDDREMLVEKIDIEYNHVSFLDVEMLKGGYPIFRSENVEFLLDIERQEREKADVDITDIAVDEPRQGVIEAANKRKVKGENFVLLTKI